MTPVLSSDVISLGSVLALGPLDGGSHDRRNGFVDDEGPVGSRWGKV